MQEKLPVAGFLYYIIITKIRVHQNGVCILQAERLHHPEHVQAQHFFRFFELEFVLKPHFFRLFEQ